MWWGLSRLYEPLAGLERRRRSAVAIPNCCDQMCVLADVYLGYFKPRSRHLDTPVVIDAKGHASRRALSRFGSLT